MKKTQMGVLMFVLVLVFTPVLANANAPPAAAEAAIERSAIHVGITDTAGDEVDLTFASNLGNELTASSAGAEIQGYSIDGRVARDETFFDDNRMEMTTLHIIDSMPAMGKYSGNSAFVHVQNWGEVAAMSAGIRPAKTTHTSGTVFEDMTFCHFHDGAFSRVTSTSAGGIAA